ncbi:unnamed protein product [Amaranthus hypochondriacus]
MFARVLVDMSLAEGFPEELFFSNEHDQVITQRVEYDWLPTWCTKCAQFGHMVDKCKLGSKEARLQVDEDGFRQRKKAFQRRVRPMNNQGGHMKEQSNKPIDPTSTRLPGDEEVPSKIPDQPPDSVTPTSEGILHAAPAEGDVGVGMASALVDVATSRMVSPSVVRNSSLALNNGFNVLNLEHAHSDTVDPSIIIALGADPIGDDD